MVRDAQEIEREENLQINIARTYIDGEREIWLEINALAQRHEEARLTFAMYGLQRRHIEIRRRETSLGNIRPRTNFILWLRSQWNDILEQGSELSVYYVEPQPMPYTAGQDMVHKAHPSYSHSGISTSTLTLAYTFSCHTGLHWQCPTMKHAKLLMCPSCARLQPTAVDHGCTYNISKKT